MKEASAIEIGTQALLFLAEDEELLLGFLGVTGGELKDVRSRADDPEFLGFVLDYLMSEDSFAERFATAHDFQPDALWRARAALPGGDAPNWT